MYTQVSNITMDQCDAAFQAATQYIPGLVCTPHLDSKDWLFGVELSFSRKQCLPTVAVISDIMIMFERHGLPGPDEWFFHYAEDHAEGREELGEDRFKDTRSNIQLELFIQQEVQNDNRDHDA